MNSTIVIILVELFVNLCNVILILHYVIELIIMDLQLYNLGCVVSNQKFNY